MPRTQLTDEAIEESTYIVTVAFTNEDGNAVTPNAPLIWTLTDTDGNVINDREDEIVTPAASVDIVLSGDDLEVISTTDDRILTVEGTFDSDAGSGLPIKDSVLFTIRKLVAVP